MATKKAAKPVKKAAKKATKKSAAVNGKTSRCWPGYEPVPGKEQHEQGSCKPKADSKLTPSEKDFRQKRRKQLDSWEKSHPHTSKSAAQHLGPPKTAKKTKAKAKAR